MEGIIVNYKGGRHRQTQNQMIIAPEGAVSREKSASFVGKKVVWTSPAGKALTGEVRSAHGNKGAIRVLFETGMPGQAVGQKVDIK